MYISALNFGGAPDRVLDLARNGEIRISISDEIEAEVMRVLRDKFLWSEEALRMTAERMKDFTERVYPVRAVDEVKEDPPDNRIIECALAGDSEYIVTGDKDLLRRKQFERIRIVSPADFLQIGQGMG